MEPAVVTDEAIDGLAYPEENDQKYFGMMYNGDAAYILSENEYARFLAPESGTNYFIDAMCVHKDSDKLYIPVEKIELLSKYSLADGSVPRLNKLGGTEWAKTKLRVRNKVHDIAKDLIKIYAERESKKGNAFDQVGGKDESEASVFVIRQKLLANEGTTV